MGHDDENYKEPLPVAIARKQLEIVGPILKYAYMRHMGLLDDASVASDSGILSMSPDETIISILADLVITLSLPRRRKGKTIPHESIKDLALKSKAEIEKIYRAILIVGFSGRIDNADAKWKNAALEAFDDSRKGFSYVQRSYLEDDSLYAFPAGKERYHFTTYLFQQITRDQINLTVGKELLSDILKAVTE